MMHNREMEFYYLDVWSKALPKGEGIDYRRSGTSCMAVTVSMGARIMPVMPQRR